jgi:hypothetical protein
VTEWAGWSFANKEWWVGVAGDQRRSEFANGQGNVAIADPDEWDDDAHPAFVEGGLFNAYMSSPTFNVTGFRPGKLFFKFDSSFRPEANDDTPAYNDQSPIIKASYNGAAPVEILHWSSDPAAPQGGVYKDDNSTNDSIIIPLNVPVGTTTIKLDIGLELAENDWWWAIDNLVVADALPEFKIIADADGDVAIVNGSSEEIDLKGYSITSASGSLLPANWESLEATGDAGAGWLENTNASINNLTETNFGGSFVIAPNEGIYLGKIFKVGGTSDLKFQILEAGKPAASSFTELDDVDPADFPHGGNNLVGDTNDDGKVDLTDLNNVRNNFGGTTGGDTNGDGLVDLVDLNNVRNNFGAVAGANAVPEPSSFALLGLGLGGLAWKLRRRK